MSFDPNSLKPLYNQDPKSHERVGFIVNDEIVEVANICSDPVNGFEVSGADILKYAGVASATWHTHPGQRFNLTVSDYKSFVQHPKLQHFIVGTDGVGAYVIQNGKVLIAS
jgi:hypothetical protein